MPLLAMVARDALGTPASTASLERLFSAAGRAVTRRRPRLQSKGAANLIFGHASVAKGIDGAIALAKRTVNRK